MEPDDSMSDFNYKAIWPIKPELLKIHAERTTVGFG